MPAGADRYDLFISYSRRDNESGQVAALKAQIEAAYRAFAGKDLRIFFDTQQIVGMDDWRQKIQRSLRESHLFLAVLSPAYLASPYCRWEWEDYVRYEAMRQCLGEGVAPVFFVTLPDAADPRTDQAIARWVDEIHHRQTFDLRPWHDHGEKALQQAHVKTTLEQLHASVRERLDRAERARRSPNNLLKHNPAFVGRVRELTDLRNALGKNKLGVVGAKDTTGNSAGRVSLQGLGGMGKTELALAYMPSRGTIPAVAGRFRASTSATCALRSSGSRGRWVSSSLRTSRRTSRSSSNAFSARSTAASAACSCSTT